MFLVLLLCRWSEVFSGFSFLQFFFWTVSERKSLICVLQDRIVLVTALSPELEQLSADTRSLGAVPSLKDNIVVVSAHHAATLQQLENTKDQLSKGILAK